MEVFFTGDPPCSARLWHASPAVTIATQITIFRIFLIPVFVGMAVYYGDSVARGQANEGYRWGAIVAFATAASSDAVDGWVARRFNQRSRLGQILDPLADKLLLLSAIITLSFTHWEQQFPLWFPLLVIFRDLAAIGGVFLVDYIMGGKVVVRPHWTGKAATFAQITAVLWVMLDIRWPSLLWPVIIAAVLTIVAGIIYMADGIRQVKAHSHAP